MTNIIAAVMFFILLVLSGFIQLNYGYDMLYTFPAMYVVYTIVHAFFLVEGGPK